MDYLELTRRLRNARPDLPERGDPLGVAAEKVMQRITAEGAPSRWRSPTYLSIAAAAAVALAVTFGLFAAVRPAPVYAAVTPPLLDITPVEGTSEELLMQLGSHLTRKISAGSIRFQSWALALTVGENDAVESVAVEPEVRVVEHSRHGSRIEVRRGQPFDSLGNKVEVDGYQIGELVWEEDFPVGGFPYVFPDAPTDAGVYAQYLQAPSGRTDLTTGDYLHELRSLLGERSLTGPQTRAALEFLATLPDLDVEGKVVDRLGRSGISFVTSSRMPGEYIDRVIISDDGLGFLSFETTYVGDERPDIQAPAVVSYAAWE